MHQARFAGGFMHLRRTPRIAAIAFLGVVAACERPAQQSTAPAAPMFSAANAESQNTALLRRMGEINAQLAGSGLEIAVEAIEFFTIGAGRPSARIHQQEFRWVPNDSRRLAEGDHITYLVDESDGRTASSLTSAQTEARLISAYDLGERPTAQNVTIVKLQPDPTSSVSSSGSAASGTRSSPTSSMLAGYRARTSRRWADRAAAAGFWRSLSRSSLWTTSPAFRPTSTATATSTLP
jgi:hypothetical protein